MIPISNSTKVHRSLGEHLSASNSSPSALPTLAVLLEQQASRLPDHVFAVFPEASITYRELYMRARVLAKGLIAHGVRAGTPVALFMPNCLDFLLAQYAVQLAGGVAVLLNARYKQVELRQVIAHCDAEILMTTDAIDAHVNLTDVLSGTFTELREAHADSALQLVEAPRLKKLVLFGAKQLPSALTAEALIAAGRALPDASLADETLGRDAEGTAVIIYTSGTTSAPKGCELSHAGLQRSWSIYTRAVGLTVGQKVWDPMPFFHSGGIGLMTGIMASGATIVSSPHFDAEVIVDLILRHRVEHLYPGFHLMALPVITSARYDAATFDFVRSMVVIGPLGTLRKIQSLLPPHAPVMNLFGMSEGSGLVTLTPPEAPEEQRLTTSGRELPGIEVRVVHPESLEAAPSDVVGEIQFRGGGAFRGYYKDPVATRNTILPGGWVRTGDMGRLDGDGWLHFDGRYKELCGWVARTSPLRRSSRS